MHSVPALPGGMHSGVCMCVLQRALNFFFRQSKSGKESAVNGQLAETVRRSRENGPYRQETGRTDRQVHTLGSILLARELCT